MTLAQLEKVREDIKATYDKHVATPPGPGQDVQKHLASIELLAAVRAMDQLIAMERIEAGKPKGATGPVLVGV